MPLFLCLIENINPKIKKTILVDIDEIIVKTVLFIEVKVVISDNNALIKTPSIKLIRKDILKLIKDFFIISPKKIYV